MSTLKDKSEAGVSAFSAIVRGRVQGVGFRYTCLSEASRMGLSGWVRNVRDGSVEVWAEGSQEGQVQFLTWLHRGPPGARVDSVQTSPQTPTGQYRNFSIKY
ncbi:MAG: acylphosphatase [Treponema sp.]|jgi:acylphosphatase|nr:acylphosphatase [Treponema sp.]